MELEAYGHNKISIHALREEGDALHADFGVVCHDFYPRPPRGGRQVALGYFVVPLVISIHALREEGDGHRGRRRRVGENFYPRPPRGGRLHSVFCPCFLVSISIHALREEGDNEQSGDFEEAKEFLSTPSARRATSCARLLCRPSRYFYPRPPRGGRPDYINAIEWTDVISIHALREEGDCTRKQSVPTGFDFYPRPPRGGRRRSAGAFTVLWYFYPRPPRGGRHIHGCKIGVVRGFLSTPSARRATSSMG